MKELPLRCDRCGDGVDGVAERVERSREGRETLTLGKARVAHSLG